MPSRTRSKKSKKTPRKAIQPGNSERGQSENVKIVIPEPKKDQLSADPMRMYVRDVFYIKPIYVERFWRSYEKWASEWEGGIDKEEIAQ